MRTKTLFLVFAAASALSLDGQQPDVVIPLTQGERPVVATPDFRGAGAARTPDRRKDGVGG